MATPTSNQLPTKEEIEEFRALIQEISDRKYRMQQLAHARKALSDRLARLHQRSLAFTNTDGKLTTFPLFPKLPIELRLKVWKDAMPTPQVIKIQTFIPNTIYDRPQDPHFSSPQIRNSPYAEMYVQIYGRKLVFRHHSTVQPFSLRTTSSESRQIFFEIHTSKLTLESGESLYFDSKNDTIHFYVDSEMIPPFLPGRGLDFSIPALFPTCIDYTSAFVGIQNLAIEIKYFTAARKDAAWLLSQFVNLKVLTLTRMKDETRDTKGEIQLKSEEDVLAALLADLKP
ncbi:hypothetical protein IFR05_011024 [Cadophora sp. M221]|nr:hypothetical protein IFR05_011024 [Cadophora sp. M221]